jgi:23S rRNA (uracil1939-C5)-methyltransferase
MRKKRAQKWGRKMKKGQIVEGMITRIDFPNKGRMESEEGVCVVKNALPGQKVRAAVNKVRKGKAEGRLLEVLEKAPEERADVCPHFGLCGGCTYLSFPYEKETQIKEEQVRRLLKDVLDRQKQACVWEGMKQSPAIYGYRNKMEFTFGDEVKDGPLSLGMHKRGSFYDIVSVTDCQIVDEDYRRILTATRDFFRAKQEEGVPVTFYHRLRHEGYLRHLLVRKAARTGEILVALVTTTQTAGFDEEALLSEYRELLLAQPYQGRIVGILHTKNDSLADVVQSDETETLYGQDFFYEELLGLRFKVTAFSFFQTNSLSAEVLYQTAREYIGQYIGQNGESIVYDLYSGTGTIAQLMAPVAKKVIGVEIVEEAVLAAQKNAELNGLHNCEFIAGDVLKVLDSIEEKPDVIILDPPRDGIHPKALDKIIRYGVEHILYISCKPTSLARDLEVFVERGYEARRAVAVDQFPWTTGIETVCLLSKLHEEASCKCEN